MTPEVSVRLVGIPSDQAAQVWPLVETWIATVCDRDGKYRPEDVLARCCTGRAQLWIAWNEAAACALAAIVTQIQRFPRRTEAEIWLVGGEDRKRWVPEALGTLEAWAREQGCNSIEAAGRPGWRDDLAGWRRDLVIYRKEL